MTIILTLVVFSALAHHPGTKLDEVMGSKEKYFQKIDRPAPPFKLANPNGDMVELADLVDKVVVIHFIYTRCPDVCPLHAERIAEIQGLINQTPMKDQVRFITITTDPMNDKDQVLREFGSAHGLDPENWVFLTTAQAQAEDTTRKLAEAFGHKFIKSDDGYQTHGVVTHIIDRDGRWAANFHGLRFAPVNMVLYINGLINNTHLPKGPAKLDWWDKAKAMF